MSKLTITISSEAHPILKDWAEKDKRSLSSYLTVLLDNITNVHFREMYLPVEIHPITELQTKEVHYTGFKRTDVEGGK